MSKRIVERFDVTVAKPIDEVFAYVSDVSKHAEWSPTPFRIDEVSDPTFAEGTKFASFGTRATARTTANDVVVTTNEPSTRFVLTSDDKGETYVNEFNLTEVDGGTKVEKVIDMPKPGGPAGLAFPPSSSRPSPPGSRRAWTRSRPSSRPDRSRTADGAAPRYERRCGPSASARLEC